VSGKQTFLFLGLVFVVVLNLFAEAINFRLRHVDLIAASEKRWAPVAAFLPGQGLVGYISDIVDKGPKQNTVYTRAGMPQDLSIKFAVAQYLLVPRIVVYNNESTDYVIGDFEHGKPISVSHSLVLAKEFPDGLCVYQRRLK
jgi:hypothetical protein